MKSLFKEARPMRARRVCTVETLNQKEGIIMSYRVSDDRRKHVLCLCLANRTIKTAFPSELSARKQMVKYRELYKERGSRK